MTTDEKREQIYRVQANRLRAAHPQAGVSTEALVAILRACTVRVVAKGGVVCREGDPGLELFFLLRGSIAILKRDIDDTQRPVGEVEAPTLLGQMGMVDRARRSATCVAASEVILAVMGQATFQRLLREAQPPGRALRRLLLSSLTQQLISGNARLRDLLQARADPHAAGRAGLGEAFLQASGLLEGWTGEGPLGQPPESRPASPHRPGRTLDPGEGPE